MNFVLQFMYFYYFMKCVKCSTNFTMKRTIADDYYTNYDYDVVNNVSENDNSHSLILPNPENIDTKYSVDILPKVDLPDDSLADTDLRDHDFIDNLMYVYYGSHSKSNNKYGSAFIMLGSIITCGIQIVTVFYIVWQKNNNAKKAIGRKFFLQFMGYLNYANVVFMFGVYATKNHCICETVAVLLHYLNLLSAFWLFLYCYCICTYISSNEMPKMQYIFCIAYGFPAILSMASFIITPHSFETKKFCFLSVQRGMILNYMLPVSALIILTTLYTLSGIRKVNLILSKLELTSSSESLNMFRNELDTVDYEKKQDNSTCDEIVCLKTCKSCLRNLSIIQTSYNVVWFTAVLALENMHYSSVMPVIHCVCSCALNWYIFFKSMSLLPSFPYIEGINETNSGKICTPVKSILDTHIVYTSTHDSSDNIPLLAKSEVEIKEVQDYISTISS